MSLKDIEDNRLEERKQSGSQKQLESGQNTNRPNQKLLLGTVQFYEDILHALPKSFISIFNQAGKHIEIWGNADIKSLYGLIPEELKGKLLADIYSEKNTSEIKNQIDSVFEQKKSSNIRIYTQFPKGRFWIEASFIPLLGSAEEVTAVIGFFKDISDTVKQEKELIESKEKYRNLIELAPEGIIIVNLKGIITSVNTTLLEMTGIKESDLIGKKLTHIPSLQKEYIPYFQELTETIIDDGIPNSFEFEWKDRNGKLMWNEIQASPVRKHNKLLGFQILFNDITERKLIQKDLLKSNQAYKIIFENANKAIFVLQNGLLRFCNSQMLEITGGSMDVLMKTPFTNMVHAKDRGFFKNIIADVQSGKGEPANHEIRIIDTQGFSRWIENNAVLIDWEGLPALLCFAEEVTEKRIVKEKEKKYFANLQLLSEKAIEFIELKANADLFQFIGQKIGELVDNSIVMMVSYSYPTSIAKIEHIEGSEDQKKGLLKILQNKSGKFNITLNHELIKNLSYGKLTKYNDGLFELGYNLFPKNSYSLIQQLLRVGDIYLIGLAWEGTIFGNALIFLPENKKIENPKAIETIAKLGSFSLQNKKTEVDLRKSEEKYKRIFDAYQDVYFQADIDGTILDISPSVLQIGGYLPEELQGRSVIDFFTDRRTHLKITKKLLKYQSLKDQDIQLIVKDGRVLEASINAKLIHDSKGNPSGFEGVIRDISERKRVERDFRKSEEKFKMLADYTYDWEYWVAPNGSVIYISPSCERVSGYTPLEFEQDPDLLKAITHPEDLHIYNNNLEKIGTDKTLVKFSYRIITKAKQIKWIDHTCQKVYNNEGKYLGRRATSIDITDRIKAEEDLRNSEERFKTLFFGSPDAIFVEDYDGNVLDANPAASILHKMDREELIGKNIVDLVPKSHRDQVAKDFPNWITGEFVDHRGFAKTLTGECIPIEIHCSKIKYSGKNALLFITRDITKIKESEDKLREALEKAEEADMLKSVFLANMSHEIRTPMNAIIGFSEILSDQELTKKERQEFINYITQGSNTLMNLIEDIIDITKIEAGQIKINIADCDIDKLMDELYAMFLKMKNKNGKQNIELRLNKPLVKEGFSIPTDPSRIRQILSNLLGNALKFTEEGYIEFGFTLDENDMINFYVKDTGIGIPKNKQELIFERFGQIEDSEGREHKGTGLGLSISKKLAELLGGTLYVNSEENQGSTFYLSLPVNIDYVKEETTEKESTSNTIDWSDKLFLIAEDSILNYTYLEALFQKTNVKLLWAKDGKEAIDLCLENDEIDLVLMDIKMPVLNGLEAITEIKKFRKDLPIVVQTAYAMPEDRDRSLEAGGDEHLTKPINPDELFSTINRFLN